MTVSPSVPLSSSRCTSLKSRKPKKQVKARGDQPSLPGLEPSSAWLAMKASAPKIGKDKSGQVNKVDAGPGHPSWQRNVVPGKCTCDDRVLETGEKINPWVYGHAYWCSMFRPHCEDCQMSSGTHTPECSFWTLHPTITPF